MYKQDHVKAVPSPIGLNRGHDSELEGLGKTGGKDIGCYDGLACSVTVVLDFTAKKIHCLVNSGANVTENNLAQRRTCFT